MKQMKRCLVKRLAQSMLLLVLFLQVWATCIAKEPLKIGIWSVEKARAESFQDITTKINPRNYTNQSYPYINEQSGIVVGNQGSINTNFWGFPFYLRSTADGLCTPINGRLTMYCYNRNNLLFRVLIGQHEGVPTPVYMYSVAQSIQNRQYQPGELMSVTYLIDQNNRFVFSPKGDLLSYWENGQCYYPDGSQCGARWHYDWLD